MRILIVSEDIPYPSMGGLAKHALNLARALIHAGHIVDILGGDQHPIEVCGDEGKFGGRFHGELNGQHAGWKEISFGVFMPMKRSTIARHFARIIMRHAPSYDVVHYHGHIPNVASFIPAHINFVQTRHDQGSDCFRHTRFRDGRICNAVDPAVCASCITPHPNGLQKTISTSAVVQFRREVATGFRRHKTVFVSDMLQENLTRTLGSGPWGTTVHNFIDPASLRNARRLAMPRSAGEFHIAIAGKIYSGKGTEAFLDEFAPRMRADMHVWICGDGPDEKRLREKFKHPRIHFLGWCTPEATLETAASSHAVVVPSILEEAFGVTTLEGLMLGKPTFALRLGGTPELARYASSPGQLRLHADMVSLVDDLLGFDPQTRFECPPEEPASAERAVRQLVEVYRSSPTPVH